ncbi:hypothetical protein C8J57DRAFT_1247162 [Mycena rebaudengoi]|nr:hypothetical protein C8J57DRAFT_1247162 [Mycena rebaudengoi]
MRSHVSFELAGGSPGGRVYPASGAGIASNSAAQVVRDEPRGACGTPGDVHGETFENALAVWVERPPEHAKERLGGRTVLSSDIKQNTIKERTSWYYNLLGDHHNVNCSAFNFTSVCWPLGGTGTCLTNSTCSSSRLLEPSWNNRVMRTQAYVFFFKDKPLDLQQRETAGISHNRHALSVCLPDDAFFTLAQQALLHAYYSAD